MRPLMRSLLGFSPAIALALTAGIMPDTFLENPNSVIRHQAAFVLRLYLVVMAFGCVVLVFVARACLWLDRKLDAGRPVHNYWLQEESLN